VAQLARDMWGLVMRNIIDDPTSTGRERELAMLCSELIEEGKDSHRVQRWLLRRSQLAEKGMPE